MERYVVVVHPSVGMVLATAAICRCCQIQPRILLAEEVGEEHFGRDAQVICLDYLVTLANCVRVPDVNRLAEQLVNDGHNVVGFCEPQASTKNDLAAMVGRAIEGHRKKRVCAYDSVLKWLTLDYVPDETALRLAVDGAEIDIRASHGEAISLGYEISPEVSTEPELFRSGVAALLQAH